MIYIKINTNHSFLLQLIIFFAPSPSLSISNENEKKCKRINCPFDTFIASENGNFNYLLY